MATIFSKIIEGQIPCYKVGENEKFFAFLDINPLVKGHTLVVPKRETDYFFDIEPVELGEFIQFAQVVAGKIREKIDCKRVAVVVLGLDVPHAHIHLIPMNDASDVDFGREKLKLSQEEFQRIAKMITV